MAQIRLLRPSGGGGGPAAATVAGAARHHADSPPDRPRRVRDPHRRPARRLGAGLLRATRSATTTRAAMTDIGTIGSNSAKIGSDLAELLTTPGLKQAELETQLGGLIQQQQQDVVQAQGVDVPGPLRPATDHAVEALELARRRHAGAARHVQGDEGRRLEGRDRRRARSSRRRRGGSMRATSSGRSCSGRPPRRRSRTRASATSPPRRPCSCENVELYTATLDDGDLAPRPRRLDRGQPVGRPRHGAREGRRAACRHPALARHGDDDQGVDGSRLRRRP